MRHRPTALARLTVVAFAACATMAGAQAPSSTTAPTPVPALTLDQAMAHPDWIGPPVETAWWALDGQQAYFTLKRAGSPVRDTWRQPIAGGAAVKVEGADLATLDTAQVEYDGSRRRSAGARCRAPASRHV